MTVALIIFTVFTFVITLNLFISAEVEYDIIKNLGKVKIKFFFITVFNAEVSLIAGYFNLFRKKKKVLQIKIDFNDKNFQFVEDVTKYFIEKITLTNLRTSTQIELDDPAVTSIVGGNFIVINGILKSILQRRYDEAKIENSVLVGFDNIDLTIQINAKIFITIFDFIWALVKAGVKRSLYGKRQFARNS